MTLNIDLVIRQSAESALWTWGQECVLEDLIQDLWVWYLESPATQRTLGELNEFQARKTVRACALQMLSTQALASDTFNGRTLYSSEAVKDVLKGRSTHCYLKDIMPIARRTLDKQNPGHAEAIRIRYEDGVVPTQGAPQVLLHEAVRSLTEQVNIIVILAGDVGRSAVFPETRKAQGRREDPTAALAAALIRVGDDPLELEDKEGHVTTTTYREVIHPGSGKPKTGLSLAWRQDDHNIMDAKFNGAGGSEMYRAQLFPELFPHPKPMLVKNWPAEDREAYCGGEWTPGYLRLVKGTA